MTRLRSGPSIFVLWNQTLVLTTMMSPGWRTVLPLQVHQHSGGGRVVDVEVSPWAGGADEYPQLLGQGGVRV